MGTYVRLLKGSLIACLVPLVSLGCLHGTNEYMEDSDMQETPKVVLAKAASNARELKSFKLTFVEHSLDQSGTTTTKLELIQEAPGKVWTIAHEEDSYYEETLLFEGKTYHRDSPSESWQRSVFSHTLREVDKPQSQAAFKDDDQGMGLIEVLEAMRDEPTIAFGDQGRIDDREVVRLVVRSRKPIPNMNELYRSLLDAFLRIKPSTFTPSRDLPGPVPDLSYADSISVETIVSIGADDFILYQIESSGLLSKQGTEVASFNRTSTFQAVNDNLRVPRP